MWFAGRLGSIGAGLLATAALVLLPAAGCRATSPPEPGAALWARSCSRCHYPRSPDALSDAEWEVVLHHMRVRTNLLPREEEAILEFLKSGN